MLIVAAEPSPGHIIQLLMGSLPMMAMASDWTINDFRETCFTYPSLGALFKSAANRAEQRIQTDSMRNRLTGDQAA